MKVRGNFVTERAGVNHVRGVVEGAGSYFKEINLQHDVGQDATIMLVVDGHVRPREVALQIKSGASYVSSGACQLPATAAHIYFWAKHDLITLGVVYDPAEDAAYWLDLQTAAREHYARHPKSGTTFTFAKAEWNRFDIKQFPSIIVPALLGEPPNVTTEVVCTWIASNNLETHDLGIRVLRARHFREAAAWNALIDTFLTRPVERLSPEIAIALAKLLGHDDFGYYSGEIPHDVRQGAAARVLTFGAREIAKLLTMMDDYDFERPSFGYSLMPLWGSKAESPDILAAIAEDPSLDDEVRTRAAGLYEWHRRDPFWWRCWRRDTGRWGD